MQPSCAARAGARAAPLTEHCLRAQEALCAMDPAVAESLILLSSPDGALSEAALSDAALGEEALGQAALTTPKTSWASLSAYWTSWRSERWCPLPTLQSTLQSTLQPTLHQPTLQSTSTAHQLIVDWTAGSGTRLRPQQLLRWRAPPRLSCHSCLRSSSIP